MKKWIALLLALVIMATVTVGCTSKPVTETPPPTEKRSDTDVSESSETQPGKVWKVGECFGNITGTNARVDERLRAAFDTMDDVDYIVTDASGNAIQQIANIENLVEQGCEIIIFKPLDQSSCVPALKAAMDAGVTIICLDSKPLDEDGKGVYDIFTGNDDKEIGTAMGEALLETMGTEGNIVINIGKPALTVFMDRLDAFKEVIKPYPGIKILAEDSPNVSRTEAMALTENWISAYGDDIDGFVCPTDECTLGAILAFEQAGMDDVTIITANGQMECVYYSTTGAVAVNVSVQSSTHPVIGIVRWLIEGKKPGVDFPAEWIAPPLKVTREMAEQLYDETLFRFEEAAPMRDNPQLKIFFDKYADEYPLVAEYDFFHYEDSYFGRD